MGKGNGSGSGMGAFKGMNDRFYIPAMPLPVAIICCVLNFLLPGFGSALAGISVLLCARTEDMDTSTKTFSCLTSCGIGFLQLIATILSFAGWCWSCFWGVSFIVNSVEFYHNNKVEDTDINVAPVPQVQYPGTQATAVVIQPTNSATHVVKMP